MTLASKLFPWLNKHGDSHQPKRLFGRVRTSTAVLVILYGLVLWVYDTYRTDNKPDDSHEAPVTAVVPPGFVPDPSYTWVPRTQVRQPTETWTPTTTTTTTTTTTPPEPLPTTPVPPPHPAPFTLPCLIPALCPQTSAPPLPGQPPASAPAPGQPPVPGQPPAPAPTPAPGQPPAPWITPGSATPLPGPVGGPGPVPQPAPPSN